MLLLYTIYINWEGASWATTALQAFPKSLYSPSFVLDKLFLRRPALATIGQQFQLGGLFSMYGPSAATFVFGSACQPVPSPSTDAVFTLRLCWIKISSHYSKMIQKVLMSSEQEDLDRKPFYSLSIILVKCSLMRFEGFHVSVIKQI